MKVHLHNLHQETQHVHENVLHQEHIHEPILHTDEKHVHKVTEEKQVKKTVGETAQHIHSEQESTKHAPPIHQKEWNFGGWLNAWAWGK